MEKFLSLKILILATILFVTNAVRITVDDEGCTSKQCDETTVSTISRMKRDSSITFNDPMYNLQWYLNDVNGTTMNVLKAWEAGYNGQGIVISVVDTGIQSDHLEFKDRFDQNASYNFVKKRDNPTPDAVSNIARHGTLVAGVAAGAANNGKCGVGIAYKANIGGVAFIDYENSGISQGADVNQEQAISFKQDYIDIYACAWGPDDTIGSKVGYNKVAKEIEQGTRMGRNGKGNIYVFAAGNEGAFNDSCTYDGYVSDVNTFGITYINSDGTPGLVSERCPGIIAAAYARDGAAGIDNPIKMPTATLENKCSDTFSSTSAATGVGAGIFALVLQANPNLTWRDLHHIVANNSQNDENVAKQGNWFTNAAGYKVSDRYGFGVLDAMAMITAAKTWTTVPKRYTCEKEFTNSETLPTSIGSVTSKKIQITAQDCVIENLEHVVLVLNMTYSPRRNLEVQLTSPGNTKSFMLMSRKMDFSRSEITMYPTMSLHNWGEAAVGEWEVNFRNVLNTPVTGELKYYKLVLYGTTTKTVTPTTTTTTKAPTTTTTEVPITTTTTTETPTKPTNTTKASSSIQNSFCILTMVGTLMASILGMLY